MLNIRGKILAPSAASFLLTNLLLVIVGCNASHHPGPTVSTATSQPATSVALPKIPDRSFNVLDYGASGDGAKDNTVAIQSAVKAASAAGGGSVIIPAGTFLSGPITLADKINLHLDQGAVLQMISADVYPRANYRHPPLIGGTRLQDVSVTGWGVIEGKGQPWWMMVRHGTLDARRPELIHFANSVRVAVHGVRLQNAPTSHIAISHCSDVTIDGVTIATPDGSPNTDGIDASGDNLVIKNCSIADGDDNIAFGGRTSNVSVMNCNFGTGHGLSIGSYTRGGLNNLFVDHCTFNGTVSGIHGKADRDRGGLVQNLVYSNITMTNVRYPILFQSFYIRRLKDPNQETVRPVTDLTPIWKNVTCTNITATGDAPKCVAGILWGLPEAPIENFTFKNVNITAPASFKICYAKNIVFAADSHITITGPGKPLLLYQAQVEAPAQMEREHLDANQAATQAASQ
ncbi:MAG: glycosyl hydrolase family 28 protein [Phycisphaerae bacterium]|jgi:polygalacturonase